MQMAAGKCLDELVEVMDKLLSPQGCPWDREQTHQTLARYLIEESYEVIEAIKKADNVQLREELGDVLLQVIFHAALAERSGSFDLEQVIKQTSEKMIHRHPHVFASLSLNTSQEVLAHWEGFKREEGKKQLMEGIPNLLPALLRALKIQEKAARVGFDFPHLQGALDKLQEEIQEFAAAECREERQSELGDMLFALVNIARLKGLDPEAALQASNDKFIRRFNYVEEQVRSREQEFHDFSLEQLDNFWEDAKEIDNMKEV